MNFIQNKDVLLEVAKDKIVEIISTSVELKLSGNNFIGLCPFHHEKTPSFTVSPQKGIYKCFGCGQGGDAINFLMEKEGIAFPEALQKIGEITKTPIEYCDNHDKKSVTIRARQEHERRLAQMALLKAVSEVYRTNGLPYSEISWRSCLNDKRAYYKINVDGRFYLPSTLSAFKICFAPSNNFISNLMEVMAWDKSILSEIGLIQSKDDHTWDFFRQRLLFIIEDQHGRIVGFAGRKPSNDDNPKSPKYINSPESLAYQKTKILYGLSTNRNAINKAQKAILVEGYTDVMTLYDFGVQNAVATCGTAFSKEQAKLLKRFTDEVIIVRDGDEAGLNAAKHDVEIALSAGLQPRVCLLPNGEDPDSLIRKVDKDSFEEYLKTNTQDGIIWRTMLEWDEDDSFRKKSAYDKAAELLACLESELLQEEYIREFAQKKRMGSVVRLLKNALAKQKEKNLLKGKGNLTQQQQSDVINYGIYIQRNKYYRCSDLKTGAGVAFSNFVIHPIMLIVARNESKRLVEIINEHGQSFLADVDSKVFFDFNRFGQYIEGMGNFMYNEAAKPAYHQKIKRKIYAEMPTCYPIYTMGWHKEKFFTWGNGLSTTDAQFKPVNTHGIVEHNGVKYFLKAFSTIYVDIKSDDEENTFEDQINFAFEGEPKSISFKEWSGLMVDVHGENAKIAIAWYLAATFRDILYPRFNFFPHLNHFGPPSSGKSFLAWSLQYLYGGKPKSPFHLINGTDAAFFRTLSWVRNGIAWFDEYSNDVPYERVEHLKSAYDGSGREKAKGAYSHNVTRTPVNSACLITGQQQPTKDIALMERCITLNFRGKERSKNQIAKADTLRSLEKTGQLTQLTAQLQQYREVIEEKFTDSYDKFRGIFRTTLAEENIMVKDRILSNHLIPLIVAEIIMGQVEFSFDFADLAELILKQITKHSETLNNQDDEAIFWQIVDYLLAKHTINHGEDIIVETKYHEKFKDDSKRNQKRDTIKRDFGEEAILLYINFTKIIPEYQERHQRIRGKNGLDTEALKYYLRNSEAYLGQKHGKKFKGQSKSCYVFDIKKLPLEWKLSVEVLHNETLDSDED